MKRGPTGLPAWMVQRASALYLLLFLIIVLASFALAPPHSRAEWLQWLAHPAMRLALAIIFAALLAHFVFHERLGAWRSAGLALGFGGVALLTAGSVSFRSAQGLLAVGAVLLVSAMWAVGANYTRRRLGGMDSLALTVGGLALASLALAPLAAATWPAAPPPPRAWLEMAFLGVASSGLGFLLYYRLLRRIGPVRAMSVTFLNPVVALIAGALYLGETVSLQTLAGAAVVLVGTSLSLGLWPGRPRA